MAAIDSGFRTEGIADYLDPRETMRALPRFIQYPLTLFTGKPLAGQKSLSWWTPGFHLATAALSMAVGVGISCTALILGAYWLLLLLPGWAVTLHGMRNLRMMIYHQCSHRNMYRNRRLDTVIGRATSSLLIIQNFARYSREHVSDHHAAHHMTLRDPTVQAFLVSLNLHPGMTHAADVAPGPGQAVLAVVPPQLHGGACPFVLARLRPGGEGDQPHAVRGCGGGHRGDGHLAYAAHRLVRPAASAVPGEQHPAAVCEAHLPRAASRSAPGQGIFRQSHQRDIHRRTGSFSGSAGSETRGGLVRLDSPHAVRARASTRFLVLTGDTVVHDFHHRYPSTPKWANYIFERQADADRGSPGWGPYKQVWGIVPAINLVFDSLSAADPEEFDIKRLREVSKRELFAAFDD